MMLSIVIPAFNEAENIGACLTELRETLGDKHQLDYELIVVDDNSSDETVERVLESQRRDPRVRLVRRTPPSGFGRAVRSGIEAVRGDVVIIYMADLSDDAEDAVAYYRKIQEGYDCVFGSRFIQGSQVQDYPRVKRFVNRIVNNSVRFLFRTRFNDLTNAFKAYRTNVIRDCGPYRSCHFNITVEMSLSALIRKYDVAQIPIRWYGRTWGSSKLKMREMGRKYLCTTLMMFFQKLLISDDLLAERLANNQRQLRQGPSTNIEQRLAQLEQLVSELQGGGEQAVARTQTASTQTASEDQPVET